MQFIAGLLHSLSFFNNPEAENESKQQLFELMGKYKMVL